MWEHMLNSWVSLYLGQEQGRTETCYHHILASIHYPCLTTPSHAMGVLLLLREANVRFRKHPRDTRFTHPFSPFGIRSSAL